MAVQPPFRPADERSYSLITAGADEEAGLTPTPRPRIAATIPPPRPGGRPGSARLAAPPEGMVTFLFTDIEGSTQLWERFPQEMSLALASHDALLRKHVEAHHGVVFKTTGDGLHAAFARPLDALAAALAAQRALRGASWAGTGPLRVRMAIHSGVVEGRDGDYFGPPVNRAARLLAAGHGSQVLLSGAAEALVREQLPDDLGLRSLGVHRLKDLTQPEHIFQLTAADLPDTFPALRTLAAQRANLPAQPTPLVARELELQVLCGWLAEPEVRLLTLTGPGGIGKTRLALQVAADTADSFTDGVVFVDLSPINEAQLVVPSIARALGLREVGEQPLSARLRDKLYDKHLLLLLDNFEQVVDAAPQLAELLGRCPSVKALVTSRQALRLRGEREFPVPPLPIPDCGNATADCLAQYGATALFVQRARAIQPDFTVTDETAATIAAICQRLDGLPLAIELAAVRAKLLPPAALLARLEHCLSLLTSATCLPDSRRCAARSPGATICWTRAPRRFSGGWRCSSVVAPSQLLRGCATLQGI
jgi:class 3 adenylate cyclase